MSESVSKDTEGKHGRVEHHYAGISTPAWPWFDTIHSALLRMSKLYFACNSTHNAYMHQSGRLVLKGRCTAGLKIAPHRISSLDAFGAIVRPGDS